MLLTLTLTLTLILILLLTLTLTLTLTLSLILTLTRTAACGNYFRCDKFSTTPAGRFTSDEGLTAGRQRSHVVKP